MDTTLPFDTPDEAPRFDGATYDAGHDHQRLGKQALRVFGVMRDGQWRTLRELADASDSPEASVSARLRDFRKSRFGFHEVQRQRRRLADGTDGGTWEYRLVPNPQARLKDVE